MDVILYSKIDKVSKDTSAKLSGIGLKEGERYEKETEILNPTWNDGYVYAGEYHTSDSYGYISLEVQEGNKVEVSCPGAQYGMRWVDLMNGTSLKEEQTNKWEVTIPSGVDHIFISVPNTIKNNENYIIGITYDVARTVYSLDITDVEVEEETEETYFNDNEIEWTTGVYHSNGTIYTGGTYDNYHYAFFDVKPGDEFSNESGFMIRNVCTFNGSKYLSKGAEEPLSYTVPTLVNKIALTKDKTKTDRIVVGHKVIVENHTISDSALGDKVEEAVEEAFENNDSAYVKPKNTTFFELSNNLIDPWKTVDGYFVNQGTGEFASNSAHTRTDYIPVDASTKYVLMDNTGAKNFRYAFYTEQKAFISGAQMNGTDLLITSPNNAAFIALSLGNHSPETWMLKKYTNNFDFEPFDLAYVKPEYIAKQEEVVMNLPSKIYALVGYECNIYFENLVEHWERYSWKVTCSKGKQMERGYKITPVSGDVGQYAITIKAYNGAYETSRVSTLIITSADARSGESDNVMILGDSTTNNGIAVTKLNLNLSEDVYSITTIGTRGTSPNNHEGRSGWTFEKYFNPPNAGDISSGVENPWYNPSTQTFDADYYFTQTGIEKPDWFFINLGINDTFSYGKDASLYEGIETIKGYCDSMIESMNDASESTKIGICLTIPPNHSQDAFGKEYGCNATRDRYKRNNVLFVDFLIREYGDREEEGIYLIPIYANLDTVFNMGLETLPVNARNTSITYESPIANGGVHPVESGYWQIADVYTAFLKAQ